MKTAQKFWFIASIVFFIGAESTLLSLGSWQYIRMQQKIALKQEIQAQAQHVIEEISVAGPSDEWKKVTLEGRFDETRQMVLLNQKNGLHMGKKVLTPLILKEDVEVIVDRGWIPLAMQPPRLGVAGEIEITGILRNPPKRQGWLKGPSEGIKPNSLMFLDLSKIPNKEKLIRLPLWVQAHTSTHASITPVIHEFPYLPPERHKGYMLTWFILAGLLPLMYGLAIRHFLKKAS